MSVLDAAYNVVHDHPGGASALAPRLGKRSDVLSHEVKAYGSAKLGLVDAVKVTELTGDLRILHAFAVQCGQVCVPLPDGLSAVVDGQQVLVALGKASHEFAQLCAEVCAGLADGTISDNELARIDRESGQLVAMLHVLSGSIRANNLAAKPAVLRGSARVSA